MTEIWEFLLSLITISSKHLLISKTRWRRLQDVFWIRLEDVITATIFHLSRRLWVVFKTSWKARNRYAEGDFRTSLRYILKMFSRRVFKTSWRRLKNKKMCTGKDPISISKKSKYFSDESKANTTQNALIRAQ